MPVVTGFCSLQSGTAYKTQVSHSLFSFLFFFSYFLSSSQTNAGKQTVTAHRDLFRQSLTLNAQQDGLECDLN